MLGYNTVMTETTSMTFDEALLWAFGKRAIVRFFESADHEAKQPTVRVVVVASNLEDRYTAILPVGHEQTIQEAMVEAITQVKEEYEAKETDLAASDRRRATMKAVK